MQWLSRERAQPLRGRKKLSFGTFSDADADDLTATIITTTLLFDPTFVFSAHFATSLICPLSLHKSMFCLKWCYSSDFVSSSTPLHRRHLPRDTLGGQWDSSFKEH